MIYHLTGLGLKNSFFGVKRLYEQKSPKLVNARKDVIRRVAPDTDLAGYPAA